MTNNEILQSNLLDIIFDKRNKDYGAYALRKDYNHRLLTALITVAALIGTFILLSVIRKESTPLVPKEQIREGIILKTIEIPKPIEPEKPNEPVRTKAVEKIATVKFTSNIQVKPDKLVTTIVPTVDDMKGKQIDIVTTDGKPKDDIVKPVQPAVTNTTGDGNETITKPFVPVETQPEFPGGHEAWMRFMRKHLITPEELQAGDVKMVQVKFKVDVDGSISDMQIIHSAGDAFDNEVIRVCKKMPKWRPAAQNGVNVPIYYLLPVTFIGVEE